MVKKNSMLTSKNDGGTFLIQVQYNQNSTWQGKILWVEKNKTQYFRSALEMLMLMESGMKDEILKNEKHNKQIL